MTELAESVALGFVIGTEVACPFDHNSPDPPTVNNDFVGDATTLASNMGNKVSTVLADPFKPTGLVSIKSPNALLGHPFWDGHPESSWPIEIPWKDGKSEESGVHRYPVTCAAHHLIPAQESLKRALPLHAFMIKKDETEEVAEGKSKTTVGGGVVYSDVGYGVNGSENGLFLPGNYAVSGLTMDDPHWTRTASVLSGVDWEAGESPDNENVAKPQFCSSPKLTGARHQIDNENRKWLYVKQVVKKCPGQFHDRHVDYSNWVVKVMKQIATEYQDRYAKVGTKTGCPDCRERAKKFTADGVGIPTPFGLLGRLNGVSTRLSSLLKGNVWCEQVVTSNWGRAYVIAKRTNNPAVD